MAQSRNVVARTLDRHAKANQSIRATAGNMSKLYIQTRQRLNDALQKAVLGGNAYTGKGLVNLIEAIQRQYAKLEEQYRSEFKRAIPYVTESFYHDALHDLDKSVIGPFDPYRVKAALADSYTHIAGATGRMAATEVSFLRNQAAQIFREVSMGGMTGKQASRELLERLLTGDPQFKFTDARGRVWNTQSYTEMLGRTVLMNAGRSAYLDTCVDNGDDVVAVSVSGNPCPACAEWENRLLSITGSDKSLPTVEDATAGGLFHPNCTHSLVAVSDYDREHDYTKEGRPEEGYNAPGDEHPADKEAWSEYRRSNAAQDSLKKEAELCGAPMIKGEHTAEQDLAATNPNYSTGKREYTHNCQRCVTAYEARRRGIDVEAMPRGSGGEPIASSRGWAMPYQNPKIIDCSSAHGYGGGPAARKNIISALDKMPDGARCAVQVMYKNGGHVFIAERIKGKTVFYDPQLNGLPIQLDAKDHLKGITPKDAYVCRLDNLKFNSNVKMCVQRRKE